MHSSQTLVHLLSPERAAEAGFSEPHVLGLRVVDGWDHRLMALHPTPDSSAGSPIGVPISR